MEVHWQTNNLDIVNIFPTPIGVSNLGRNFTDSEMNFFNNLEYKPNSGNKTSVEHFILDMPEMKNIRDFCRSRLNEYFKKIYEPEDSELSIILTQSWVNYSEAGMHHHIHSHPNSFLSGVFYIKTNPTDVINFVRSSSNPGGLANTINYEIMQKSNDYNCSTYYFNAREGMLLLFPSTLTHLVPTLPENSKPRISLSFNTYFKGRLGSLERMTALYL